MKKLVTILLLSALLLACFAGCTEQKVQPEQNSTDASTESTEDGTKPSSDTTDPTPDPEPTTDPGIYGDLKTNVENAIAYLDDDASNNPADFAVDVWDGTTEEISWFTKADVVAAKTYNITTAAELMGFRSLIEQNSFEGWKITLGKSIDLASKPMQACVGSFAGSFDGQGNVICNLRMDVADSGFGFFSTLTGNACVQNLGLVKGSYEIADDINSTQLGTLCGLASLTEDQTVTISNIYSNVDFVRPVVLAGTNNKVGGILGEANGNGSIKLENCLYEGEIDLFPDDNMTYNRNQGAMTAGIVGYFNETGNASVYGCIFNGTLDAARMSGGILAVAKINSSTLTISDCIVGENAKLNLKIQDQNPYAGGIVGRVSSAVFKMSDCSFNGFMTATMGSSAPKQAVGGLIGVLFDNGESQRANASATLTDCQVNGTVIVICEAARPFNGDVFIGSCEREDAKIKRTNLTTGADFRYGELEKSAIAEFKYDLRYVAALDVPATGYVVGFEYSIYVKNENVKVARAENVRIFAELVAQKTFDDGKTYTAADFGADYLYVLELEDFEAKYSFTEGNLEVVITPFVATQAGDVVTFTNSYTVQYGAIVIEAPAA